MSVQIPIMTPEQFDQWALRPDHADRAYEFIAGDIVEKMVSNQKSARIGAKILAFVVIYSLQNNLGRVTGEQGGYNVGRERYIPDVGYISRARQPIASDDPYNPLAPDLAVEVLSPSDSPRDMRIKIGNYLAAGTTVWLVSPDDQSIEIYVSGQTVRVLGLNDTLDGGAVLPGFTLAVKDVFAD